MLYIRKPITVYAHQWFPGRIVEGVRYEEHCEEDRPGEHLVASDVIVRDNPYVITTDGVRVYVEPGDYIIYQPNGTIEGHWICKPEDFKNQYEFVGG